MTDTNSKEDSDAGNESGDQWTGDQIDDSPALVSVQTPTYEDIETSEKPDVTADLVALAEPAETGNASPNDGNDGR